MYVIFIGSFILLINNPVLLLTKSPFFFNFYFFSPVASPRQVEKIKSQVEGSVRTGVSREEIVWPSFPPPNINLSGLHDSILLLYHTETIQTDLSNSRSQYTREPAANNARCGLYHAAKYQIKGCHQLCGLLSVCVASNPPGRLIALKVAW